MLEKPFVPCAWTILSNVIATTTGRIIRAAWISFDFLTRCANFLTRLGRATRNHSEGSAEHRQLHRLQTSRGCGVVTRYDPHSCPTPFLYQTIASSYRLLIFATYDRSLKALTKPDCSLPFQGDTLCLGGLHRNRCLFQAGFSPVLVELISKCLDQKGNDLRMPLLVIDHRRFHGPAHSRDWTRC